MNRLSILLSATLLASSLIPMPGQQDVEELSVLTNLPVEQLQCNVLRRKVREFSLAEAQALMTIADAEAGNQGIIGRILVMAVVLNRVAGEEWPDNIIDVINQDGQVQPISDGRYYEVKISREAHLALAYIEKGYPIDTEIIGFEATSNDKVLEKYFKYAYTVGGHDFYVRKPEVANEM